MLSGGGESDDSEDAVENSFAMICVGRCLLVVVMEVAETIKAAEVVRSGVKEGQRL
jgi:hypothetical protein